MSPAIDPDRAARERDEIQLAWLSLWDQGQPASAIAAQFAATRNAVIAFVWRVHQADSGALERQPASRKGGPWSFSA